MPDEGSTVSDAADAAAALEVHAEDGPAIVQVSLAGTMVFTLLALLATVAPDTFTNVLAAASIALFAVGVGAFAWSYVVAVGRSRTDAIGIGGLYFLSGSAPRPVRRRLLGSLAVEVLVAIVSSSIHPFTAVAFGILVPMFGLGLSGLWGARHGVFGARSA